MEDSSAYILYIVILAIVAIASLVRKAIEKATAGESGKKLDLAKAVQRQLRKYMGNDAPPEGDSREAATPEPGAPVVLQPPPSPQLVPPVVTPPRQPLSERLREAERKPTPVIRSSPARETLRPSRRPTTPPPNVRRPPTPLPLPRDRESLRRAVVMAEVLGPPVGERADYRLF